MDSGQSANRQHPPTSIDSSTLPELACPACFGDLRAAASADRGLAAAQLICAACGRAYPVIDGIPVLIVDRAESSGPSQE